MARPNASRPIVQPEQPPRYKVQAVAGSEQAERVLSACDGYRLAAVVGDPRDVVWLVMEREATATPTVTA